MAISPQNFAELEGVIQTVYDLDLSKRVDHRAKLFNIETSKRGVERHYGLGSLGLMGKWTGTVQYSDFGKRWPKDYRHCKYDGGITIEREILDDKEYGEIKRRTRLLALMVYNTIQTQAASVFNNAFSTTSTYADGSLSTGPDGVALCSATHDVSPSDGTHWSNTGTDELDIDHVTETRIAMAKFTDDKGNLLGVDGNLLIVGTDLRDTAKEICKTNTGRPGINDHGINPVEGEMDYVVFPQMNRNPKAWFLADKAMMKLFLNWENRRTPRPDYVNDFDTELGKYKVVGRWSFGWDEAFWVYGHNPA